jgi:hypothetical protein
MAFEKITPQDLQNKGVIGLADTPGLDTSAMQHKFDEIALDVIVPAFNDLIDDLEDAGYDPTTGDLMHRAVYDSDNDGIVDNAEKVNNHTVEEDVPEGAVFTDTTYSAGDNITISEENEISATVPTKTSDLTNDSGFITNGDIPTKTSDLTNDSGFITSADVPTKTSDLTNDSGFITASDIPAIPSKTSDLTNDSGFITSSALPTKVSDLTNDAGYITSSALSDYYTETEVDNITGDLSDLDTTDKTNLVAAINEVAQGGGGGSSTLAGLDDVSINNPVNGQALIYQQVTGFPGQWINRAIPGNGDMDSSDYDPDSYVKNAGGIPDYVSVAVSTKANKLPSGTAGDVAVLLANGNYDDSGVQLSNLLTKVTGSTSGNFASLDGYGALVDSGHKHSDYLNVTTYDPNGTVASAGGIVDYIDDVITSALTASY